MSRIIDVLKDPHIVSNIQNFFGVSYNKDPASQRITNENEQHCPENKTMLRKKSNITLNKLEDNDETDELNHKTNNGLLNVEESASKTESDIKNLPEIRETRNYTVKNKFWYFVFLFGTYLGDDIGYGIMLPFYFWNVDASIGRKIVLVWTLVMYLGQVSKDIIRWPRPPCPPVIRLQKKWSLEYGMPSTHAMVGVALPSSVLYYTSHRYKFPVELGVFLAVLFCVLISLSRLYLGMHSLLDILAGLLLSSLLVIPFLPLVDFSDTIIKDDWFPLSLLVISVILIVMYPSGNTWTPTRGDTTAVLATCVGIHTASWLNYRLHWIENAPYPPPYEFNWPEWREIAYGTIRTLLGYFGIVISFLIFEFVNKILDWILIRMKVTVRDVNTKHRIPVIDLVYKYLSCSVTAFHIMCSFPYIFQNLNINRKSFYWE